MANTTSIERLYKYGHFFNPEVLKVGEVTEADLPKLTPSDPVVQAATRSYQEWFKPQLDQITLRSADYIGGHERVSIADGDLGPATDLLLAMPRCGMPDYMKAGSQEANWPDQCRNELTMSYRLNLNGINSEEIHEAWQNGMRNWSENLELMFKLENERYPNTRFWANQEPMSGSTLAWHYLAVNHCGARLEGRYNTRVNWSKTLFQTTMTHEVGHGLGFEHLRDSQATMYPSITQASMNRGGAPHTSDMEQALRVGYKRRTTPPIPEPPEPPAPPDGNIDFVKVADGIITMAAGTSGKSAESIQAGLIAEFHRRAGNITHF